MNMFNKHFMKSSLKKMLLLSTVLFSVTLLAAFPVSAGTQYMSGSPDLSAALMGQNEFTPGDFANLSVNIENHGLNDLKFVRPGIVDRDDLPNTAKLVKASLGPGNSGVIIKTDPQMIGDIKGGTSTQVKFQVKIPKATSEGTLELPLDLKYTYLDSAEQEGLDSINYIYRDKDVILPLVIKIKKVIALDIINVTAEQVNAGTEGYVTLDLQNSGQDSGKKAIIKIVRNPGSPVIPVEASKYIGDFTKNSTIETKFKISVDKDAQAGEYPLDVVAVYENGDGDTVSSLIETVSIPVGGKIDFAIDSPPNEIHPGEKKVLDVSIKNTGAATAYSAQARISAVDPFTSSDDTSYLGDMKPGESVDAHFEVTVDKSAVSKDYGLDTEVRYRDSLDNSQVSDTMKLPVKVTPAGALSFVPYVIIVIILIGAGYYYYFIYRKKKGQ